ncbi:MAG: nucleoside deaminase [Candidatus Rokuibacteriota bacterium]
MMEWDLRHLRTAIAVSRSAREHGNEPYGALLVGERGDVLLQAENTEITARDATGHAETNLVRIACARFDPATLAQCTIYASTEPCAMCAGAIYWGHIGRVVFGLGQETLPAVLGDAADRLALSCHAVLARGTRPIEVVGPLLEKEARAVVEGGPP